MPVENRFRHQQYPTAPGVVPVLKTLDSAKPFAGSFHELHSRCGIGRVVLVHGTFMGDDPFGIAETLRSIGKQVPLIGGQLESLARTLQQHTQPVSTAFVNDVGTYTAEFRQSFQSLVGDDPQIEIFSPTWSSQNHHLARADLAVRLIHQLINRPLPDQQKVLLWGHSHAGNAFALLTNLLANHQASVDQFFNAVGDQTEPYWTAVRSALRNAPTPHPLAEKLVIATFETPVRYGWDTTGCSRLMHTIFHRPHDPDQPFLTKPLFPPHLPNEIIGAVWGDWIQAFAIAGTDVSSVVSQSANEKLTELLEANLPQPAHELDTKLIPARRLRDTCARWKSGTRCHADGQNLLVDYTPSGQTTTLGVPLERSLLGHGVATTIQWLPAHLALIIEALSEPAVG